MDNPKKKAFITANTPIFLTGCALFFILLLLLINFVHFLLPPNQGRLSLKGINGMAVQHNTLLYTLNLEQQMAVATLLNRASPTEFKRTQGENSAKNIQTLYLYPFGNKPAIEIIPLGYVDNNLVFSVPDWSSKEEFIESSNGKLKEILSHTFD